MKMMCRIRAPGEAIKEAGLEKGQKWKYPALVWVQIFASFFLAGDEIQALAMEI